MGYHTRKIDKGVIGEISKIREELEELEDAALQKANIMVLCELSDMVGAMKAYLKKHHPSTTLSDLIKMSELTESAFQDGSRS